MSELQVIIIDKKTFEKTITKMPWLAFSVLEKMSRRIRETDRELLKLKKVAKQPARASKTKP
jgi:CRP-like cAMP-binding protein